MIFHDLRDFLQGSCVHGAQNGLPVLFEVLASFSRISALTRAPLGGYFEPPSRFLAISSKPNAGVTTNLAVPSLPTFLHIVLKF